jgi:hypothetical protein
MTRDGISRGARRRFSASVLTGLLLLSLPSPSTAQRLERGSQWIEITLERNAGASWQRIAPGTVLERDDLVRFRFRTNFEGWLYVINQGTSGRRVLLFPTEDAGRENRVLAEQEYVVPSMDTAFRIAGPAGHDIVYWLLSPVALEGDANALLRQGGAPDMVERPAPKLIPRCDGTIMRARGACIDSSAGPRNTIGGSALRARDLVIMQNKEVTRVSSPHALTDPTVYEFRLAHR